MQMQTEGGLLFRGPFCITKTTVIFNSYVYKK